MNTSSKIRLSLVGAREPQDGWSLSEPLPVSARTRRALRGVIRALLPPPPAPQPADIELRVEAHVRSMLQYMPLGPRLGFLAIVRLLEWSPLWRMQAPSRLSALSPERANQVLAAMSASRLWPVRLLLLGPKALVMSTYFDQDEVHLALDYEPRAFLRDRVTHRANLASAHASQSAESA